MSKLAVRELPKAEADLGRLLSYLSNRSPQGAANWLDAYEAAIELISRRDFPRLFAQENSRVEETLYQHLFGTPRGRTYRAVYLVEGDELIVVRLRGPGQALLKRAEIDLG